MPQRSLQTKHAPQVTIRAGGDVRVEGWDRDQVSASTENRWGLKLEQHDEAGEVNIGFSGEVMLPFDSHIKVYAGKSVNARNIQGSLAVYAGWKVHIREVRTILHISAGGPVDFECDEVKGDDVKFAAGGNVRCHIRLLADARLMIHDARGYWEGVIGKGRVKIRFKSGGSVTLVTDQKIVPQPPHYLLGKLDKPSR